MTSRSTGARVAWLMAAAIGLLGCDDPGTEIEVRRSDAPAHAERATDATPVTRASARLAPVGGSEVRGIVVFNEVGDTLEIHASVSGLEPGRYGFHLHEGGDCSGAEATAAGGHFAPEGDDPHGAPTEPPPRHHAGDLGNLAAPFGGTAIDDIEDAELTLVGEFGVVGRAVIVHAAEDDLVSQPSGEAGPPIACGVVRLDDDASGQRPPGARRPRDAAAGRNDDGQPGNSTPEGVRTP